MQKRLFLRLALATLMSVGMYALAAPAPTALAAAPTTLRMSGPSASANYFGQEGDTSWNVSINLYAQTTKTGNTTTQSMRVEVYFSEFDEAAGFFASTGCNESGVCGVAAPEGAKINLPSSAYLPAVDVELAIMGDTGPTGDTFTAHVGPVTWNGEGGINSHYTSVSRFPASPTCEVAVHQIGRVSSAPATGSFSFTPPAMIGSFTTTPVSITDATTDFGNASLSYSGTTVRLFGEDCPPIF